MNRFLESSLVSTVCIVAASQVYGQISYQERADPPVRSGESIVYEYTTTWGLRDDPPDKFTMGPGWPYRTRDEAQRQIEARIAETKDSGWLTVTHGLITRVPFVRRGKGESSAPNQAAPPQSKTISSIATPSSQIVDPGPSAYGPHRVVSSDSKLLLGKKFMGAIGNVKVTFDFTTRETVVIAGVGPKAKSFEAKWSFDDQDQFVINASNAEFAGKRNGEKFAGVVTAINRTDKRQWSFDLQNRVDTSTSSETASTVHNKPALAKGE